MAGGSNHQGRTVISKISMILLAVAEGSRTLTEIAARCELPLSTAHRLVTELAAWGTLERAEDGSDRPGLPIRTVSGTGGSAIDDLEDSAVTIKDCAAPLMEDLFRAVGVRVRVGFFDKVLEVAYIQKESLYRPVSRDCAAARLPAHATALGKALLAFSPPRIVRKVLGRRLRRYTPFTLTSPESLNATFRGIRATRLAVCDRELELDSRAMAAPVFGAGGHIVAAIELDVRDLASDLSAWRPTLAVATGSLSRELVQHSRLRPAAARHHLQSAPSTVRRSTEQLIGCSGS
jgi:DNA-binding IclR family transcriptional regulator